LDAVSDFLVFFVFEKAVVKIFIFTKVWLRIVCVEIIEALTSDMSSGVICDLDTCFPVGLDNVSFDQGLAIISFTNDTVMGRSLNVVFLNNWAARIVVVVTFYLDTI